MDRRKLAKFFAFRHEFDGTHFGWRRARQAIRSRWGEGWYTGVRKGVSVSGRGSAWLERLVRDQEVGGSNPLAPTKLLIDLQRFPPNTRVQTGSKNGPYVESACWTLLVVTAVF